MKKKNIIIYLVMLIIFGLALFMLFRTNLQSFRRLNASVSPEEEKNIILEASKKYIEDNIYKFDGDSEITLKDIIINEYLSEEEIEEVTKDLYNESTRILFNVSDGKITDIYIKSELFSKLFKCADVCYLDNNNYIYYNNDLYRILKVDANGNVYIISNELEKIRTDQIDIILRNKQNALDKKISDNIDLISPSDIKESPFIDVENDVLVNTNLGYKIYDISSSNTIEIDKESSYTMYIIKLLNTINYEKGDGTKFNPYVISE